MTLLESCTAFAANPITHHKLKNVLWNRRSEQATEFWTYLTYDQELHDTNHFLGQLELRVEYNSTYDVFTCSCPAINVYKIINTDVYVACHTLVELCAERVRQYSNLFNSIV